ncbi:MAG: hypothetical protein ACKPKO_10460, partial [Candidatus Fonsibacter sp.]
TRLGLRFNLPNGELSTEQLWQLKPSKRANKVVDDLADYEEELQDELAKFNVSNRRRSATKSQEQQLLELRLAIVSHILDVREAEADEAKTIAANKEHNERIKALIAKKQEDKLGDLSVEELQALLK